LKAEDIFHATVKKYQMIQRGDRIVVGVSGGPDSITLLNLLYRYSEFYQIRLICAHLNHNFRPGDAEKDAEYVKEFCRARHIPCVAEFVDVPDMAAKGGLSSEQAGRKARYGLFNRVLNENKFNKIAVAHNMEDQVETVLMRLIRGAGTEGLGGIRPVRGNIIRPLLETPRALIEEYCVKNRLNPVTDKSNFQPVYYRNKIRLELLPYIKANYNGGIERALLDMAQILRQENDYLDGACRKIFKEYVSEAETGRLEFRREDLMGLHNAVRRRVLRMGVEYLKGNTDNLEFGHIEQVCALLESGKTGKRINLPRGLVAGIEYGKVFLDDKQDSKKALDGVYRLVIPGTTRLHEINGIIEADIIGVDRYVKQKDCDNNTAFMDFEITGRNLMASKRKEGEKFIPLGMKGTKKLKDLFIDAKVPREKRDCIPIIRNEHGIVWVAGHRIDDKYRINKSTGQVLKLEYRQDLTGEEY